MDDSSSGGHASIRIEAHIEASHRLLLAGRMIVPDHKVIMQAEVVESGINLYRLCAEHHSLQGLTEWVNGADGDGLYAQVCLSGCPSRFSKSACLNDAMGIRGEFHYLRDSVGWRRSYTRLLFQSNPYFGLGRMMLCQINYWPVAQKPPGL